MHGDSIRASEAMLAVESHGPWRMRRPSVDSGPCGRISARLGLPEEANIDDLREALEALADELMVDLTPASDLVEETEASLVL